MKPGNLFKCAIAALISAPLAVNAQTVFVDEDFESYASQGAFENAWEATAGDGLGTTGTAGSLVLSGAGVTDQVGNAATGGQGNINEWTGGWRPNPSDPFGSDTTLNSLSNPEGFLLVPTPTENIVLRGDIFIDATNGPTHRQTLGIRNDLFDRDPDPANIAQGINFVELGTWNGDVCVPTEPACETGDPGDPGADPPVDPIDPDENARLENDFAFRLVLFDSTTLGDYYENGVNLGAMQASPNWQYFQFDSTLDSSSNVLPNGNAGNDDGVVDLGDIGDGWHTFEATIADTYVQLSVDLFRDGINNATGAPGPDATAMAELEMSGNFDAPAPVFEFDRAPLNSLRFGSPSGVSSDPGVASFDNIYLALEDVVASLAGDYNGDGTVDAADYTVYRDTLGNSVTAGEGADGNGNGVIDPGDYTVWSNNFGASSATASAVPEPAAAVLALLAIAGLAARRN